MKIYILADMEGVSGIRMMEQVKRDSPQYLPACDLMMQDINVAVEAAIDAGATEVVACDTHGGGGQVRVDKMDSRAVYETPNAGQMMPSLDESFSGVMLLEQVFVEPGAVNQPLTRGYSLKPYILVQAYFKGLR